MAAKKPTSTTQAREQDTEQKQSIKTQILLGLLPQINMDHPRSQAQKALMAADEIMRVWELSDED